MRRALTLLWRLGGILVLLAGPSCGRDGEPSHFDHTHTAFDQLLAAYVADGLVDYKGLQSDRQKLQRYLASLGAIEAKEFAAFSREQQLALLINAYNAFTLELILAHYPVASIRNIPGNWTEPQWKLIGKQTSLNEIENELIRPVYQDPRIHFALVCAARGCPPLLAEAYADTRLSEQLQKVSHGYVRATRWNRLDRQEQALHISRIFQWYGEDFVPNWGKTELPPGSSDSPTHRAIIGFFAAYLGPEEADYLRTYPVEIIYSDYDWDLNQQTDD